MSNISFKLECFDGFNVNVFTIDNKSYLFL